MEGIPGPDSSEIASLITRLRGVFADAGLYRQLVAFRLDEAQKLLDSFQRLLDEPDLNVDLAFRKALIVAMQRLSARSGLYPSCYELTGISPIGDSAVAAGGFADIYMGRFKAQLVCMKVMRLYENSQIEHALKVSCVEHVLRSTNHCSISS
ncbi:hypothetical protein H0H87_008437 [Tephrocybe sp. NHM501043]|nr:hypothetical protein H0H87_008437 [Tephrocybe sp. NHM501043]